MTTEKMNDSHGLLSGFDSSTFFYTIVQPAYWPHAHLIQFQNSLFREMSISTQQRNVKNNTKGSRFVNFNAMNIQIASFLDVILHNATPQYLSFLPKNSLFYPEDERNWFLRNVGKYLSLYMTSYCRRCSLLNNTVSHIPKRFFKTVVNLIQAGLPTSNVYKKLRYRISP